MKKDKFNLNNDKYEVDYDDICSEFSIASDFKTSDLKENYKQDVIKKEDEKSVIEDVNYYDKVTPRNHESVKQYIDKRYDYYVDAFCKDDPEKRNQVIFEKLLVFKKKLSASYFGLVDGLLVGTFLGGKWGVNGGFIAGGISQLILYFTTSFVMAAHGMIIGFLTSSVEINELHKDFRWTVGSTAGDESVKNDTVVFPNEKLPYYLTKGDRKPYNTIKKNYTNPENQFRI